MRKKLVLVGGGHSHLYVLKMLQQKKIENVDVTLLSADRYQYYSGMFSGYVEGLYSIEDIRIDLIPLTKKANVKWMEGTVISVDPLEKKVLTDAGSICSFDAISFDIGSITDYQGTSKNILNIKPNFNFPKAIQAARASKKVVIVGGGPSGIEIGLSLNEWRKSHGLEEPVTLIGGEQLLQNEKASISTKIEKIVKEKGVTLFSNTSVTNATSTSLVTSDSRNIAFDHVIWLTGPKAPHLFSASKLPIDKQGYLLVEDTLQVKKYPFIFGAGDCITIRQYPNLKKIGIHAVKQGPILYKNIKGFFETGDGLLYTPQKNYLSIMSIGNKEGFLLYNGYSFFGKTAWYIKNRIDKQFIRAYKG